MPNDAVWDSLFAAIPPYLAQKISAAFGGEKPNFFEFALATLEAAGDRARPGTLAGALLESGMLFEAISNPALLPREQAIGLARATLPFNHHLDRDLLANLTDRVLNWPHDVPRPKAMRVLHVIDAISDCRRLALPLMKFAALPNRHLRSKAVKLLARASANPGWADSILRDPDPRVRANLVDGIARHLERAGETALRKAVEDPHHRVSAAALLALARLGDVRSRELLGEMAAGASDVHRKAASWAISKLDESSEKPPLAP